MPSSVERTRADRIAALLAGLIAVLVTWSTALSASEEAPLPVAPPDECGDPRLIDSAIELVPGLVTEVRGADVLVVKIDRGFEDPPVFRRIGRANPTLVRLVSVDAPVASDPSYRQAKTETIRRALGKQVSLIVSPFQGVENMVTAAVLAPDGDVGLRLLELGLARYRRFGDYDIDWWTRCHYEHAESRAKQARLGVWGP